MKEYKLTKDKLFALVLSCLYTEGEDISNAVEGAAITATFGFHPERLKAAEPAYREMIAELNPKFFDKTEGVPKFVGHSVLALADRADDTEWLDDDEFLKGVESIIALGVALGYAKFTLPEPLWPMLPNGIPFIMFYRESQRATLEA